MRIPSFAVFLDGPDGGAGGGAPAGAAPPPSAATPPAPAGAPPPAPPAAPVAGAPPPAPGNTGAPPAPPQRFEYENDRSNWLSPEQAEQQRQDAIREAAAQRDRFRAMAEAAAGIRFPEPEQPVDPHVQAARARLEQILPGITTLHQQLPYLLPMLQALQQGRVDPRQFASLPDVFSSTDAQWRRHGAAVLQPIHAAIAQDYGAENLTPRQRDRVTKDFIDWLEDDRTGQRQNRYTTGDPTLQTEFLDDYRATFIHPLQRVPGGAPGGAPPRAPSLPPAPRAGGAPMGGPPAPPAPARAKSLDEAADAAWAGLQAATAGNR